jgi:hypothetical protein
MTTNVTVETFEHEVEVARADPKTGEALGPVEIVPAKTKRVFYAHSAQAIAVRERLDG